MERERKRLEQFRRLRKEIRGSQDYLVVGIDISKDTHNALMRNTSGKILYRRLTFNNTGEGFEWGSSSGIDGHAAPVHMADGQKIPADVDGVAGPGDARHGRARIDAPPNGADQLLSYDRRNSKA